VEDLERRVKDTLMQQAQSHEDSFDSLSGTLGLLERRFREELQNTQDGSHGELSELKDQLLRTSTEHSAQSIELKEQISKLASEEKRAREDFRGTIAASLEQLEAKLRRDIGQGSEKQDGNFRESLLQERQLREKSQAALADHIADFEAKCVEQIAQVQALALDSKNHEMKEIAAACVAKERENTQGLMAKEQEYLAAQLEGINKFLLQERAARETQQEGLTAYLTSEKMAREVTQKSVIEDQYSLIGKRLQTETKELVESGMQALRKGFESQFQNVQITLRDAMEHDMQSVQKTLLKALNTSIAVEKGLATRVAKIARSPSPMPRNRRTGSPGNSITRSPGNSITTTTTMPPCSLPLRQVIQPPIAVAGVDVTNEGRPDYLVDGVSDALQASSNYFNSQKSKFTLAGTASPVQGNSLSIETNTPIVPMGNPSGNRKV